MGPFDRIAASYPMTTNIGVAIVTALLVICGIFALVVVSGMPSQYYGLLGGLFGGGGTIVAAWLAWRAVREQMRQTKEITYRNERETIDGLLAELDGLIAFLDECWYAIDVALDDEREDDSQRRAIEYLMNLLTSRRMVFDIDLDNFSVSLSPKKSGRVRHLAVLLSLLQAYFDMFEKKAAKTTPPTRTAELLGKTRYVLTMFERDLRHIEEVDESRFPERQLTLIADGSESFIAMTFRSGRQVWEEEHGPL